MVIDQVEYYSQVRARRVEWLRYPYVPYGKLTVIQGDPGEGKSTLILNIAALLSTGKPMPDGSLVESPQTIIYQCAEDSVEDTVKPRLVTAGADCDKIAFIVEDDIALTLTDERIENAIKQTGARLVILDPIQAFIPPDSDMLNATKMRSTMRKLTGVAEKYQCAIVLIGHMNNASEKLIAIRASEEDSPGAVRWKRFAEDKYIVAPIGCGAFTKLVYELMGWTDLWNTSVIAQVYSKNGQTVLVFDLAQFEINALPYKKPKPVKNRRENDIFYDIEAMIAQQIELLHQKQLKDLVIEEKPEEVELPPPKRQKFHQGNWFTTFGEKSETVAVTGRRYQYAYLNEWNVDAEAVVVEGFDQQVVYTNDDVDEALTTMVAAMSK